MPRTAVTSSHAASYPAATDAFSPDTLYPEYRHSLVSSSPNRAYAMVRRVLMDSCLDEEHADTPLWNPLGAYIAPGSKVFVLVNFVYHRRPKESFADYFAKCINASVLRAVIDYVLIAIGDSGRVTFGNSSLQSCNWQQVLHDTEASTVEDFYRNKGVSVRAQDLRLSASERSGLGHIRQWHSWGDRTDREVDLGSRSLLNDPIESGDSVPYRVADYNPDRTARYHQPGSHVYSVNREVLDADVVVSLSKLKTHEKVGITCGLKGFVGTVGHKDCLAHHRYGSSARGGDEYPANLRFLEPVSFFHDWVQRRDASGTTNATLQIIDRSLRRTLRRTGLTMTGSWHGNDTAWRMALDLARILYYANAEGALCDHPQRRHLSFIDGMIAGEGEGPLAPSPVPAGLIEFSDDVAVGDRVAARLMGFNPLHVPIVNEAFRLNDLPISTHRTPLEVTVNGQRMPEDKVEPVLGRPFRPPHGWRDHLLSKA